MLRPLAAAVVLSLLAASRLAAVSAADLVGTWEVDAPATWESMKTMPEITALPPEQQAMVKATVLTQFQSTTFEFTSDKLVSVIGGQRKEESYTVTRTEGDTLFTDDTCDGKVTHSSIEVGPSTLAITNLAEPSQKAVLKRKAAAGK